MEGFDPTTPDRFTTEAKELASAFKGARCLQATIQSEILPSRTINGDSSQTLKPNGSPED